MNRYAFLSNDEPVVFDTDPPPHRNCSGGERPWPEEWVCACGRVWVRCGLGFEPVTVDVWSRSER